jgi:tripeptide aminopeptidase
MKGSVTDAEMYYIIRDHDAEKFAWRQKVMEEIAAYLNLKYADKVCELTIEQEYRNMFEVVSAYPELLVVAEKAIRSVGLEPAYVPVRGGTDGAQLSFRGLPCPNLGAGGYGFHGPYEHLIVEELEQSVAILVDIVKQFAEMK